MTEKIAVFAPMPNASTTMTIAVMLQFFHSILSANRMSCHKVFITHFSLSSLTSRFPS